MRILSLSFHRGYACRHTGRCCTSGWPIPVEASTCERLQRELAEGALRLAGQPANPLLRFPAPVDGYAAILEHDAEGRCAFFQPAPGGEAPTCAIHARLGPDALPASCRMFPRIAVLRPGSVAISLSHYCPTAASLLFREATAPVIETEAPPYGDERDHEGLDLGASLPPLVRPDALFAWTSYDRWERFVIESVADDERSLDESLGVIVAAAERIRAWTSAAGSLDDWIKRSLDASDEDALRVAALPSHTAAARAYALAASCVPSGLRSGAAVPDEVRGHQAVLSDAWAAGARPVRRYLAARAWASWISHDGQGVRSFVRWLAIVLGVLRIELERGYRADGEGIGAGHLAEAFGRADLLLVHLLDPRRICRRLALLESTPLSASEFLPQ